MKEYLISKRIRTGEASGYSVNAELAHRSIAMTCLAYLMRFDTDELDKKRMMGDNDVALASYAAQHWVLHFKQQGSNTHRPLQDLVQEFLHLSRRAQFLNWIRMYDVDRSCIYARSPKADAVAEPLYYSCSAGLLDISEWLLTEGADIDAQGGRYGNALQVASRHGQEAIVRLLLDRGADINAQGGKYGNALQVASGGGCKATVQLLLDEGAEVNAQGGKYGNVLQASCGGEYTIELQWSEVSQDDYKALVQLLLDRGAEVNAQGG